MEKIIGLDLGTNSIGWAIRETDPRAENQFTGSGVMTFDKGVGEGENGEFPLVKQRTSSRSARRHYQARKYRKQALLALLMEKGMCPLTRQELDHWRHYAKGRPRKYPQGQRFVNWLRYDFDGDGKPDFERLGLAAHESHYVFRKLAADPAAVALFRQEPELLGRVLYQLMQRRGFRGKDYDAKDAKSIFEGSEKTGTLGRNAIADRIEQAGTLGAALYALQQAYEPGQPTLRIRKRYNLRSDVQHELEVIGQLHGFDEPFRRALWKAIIWQRPLRSQKGQVGYCTFEPGKARCPVSHPLYEEYRAYVVLNNLLSRTALPAAQNRTALLNQVLYPLFLNKSADFKLEKLVKAIRQAQGEVRWKYPPNASAEDKKKKEKAELDTKVLSNTLIARLEEIFEKPWTDICINTGEHKKRIRADGTERHVAVSYTGEDLWHVLFSFDDREKIKDFALHKLRLSEEKAEAFSRINLPQGYATLSRAAILKILPNLKRGLLYSHAVYLANLEKVIGPANSLPEPEAFAEELKGVLKRYNQERQYREVANQLVETYRNTPQRSTYESYTITAADREEIDLKIREVLSEEQLQRWSAEAWQQARAYIGNRYKAAHELPQNAAKEHFFEQTPRQHDYVFAHLQRKYELDAGQIKYLWHPSEREVYSPAETYWRYDQGGLARWIPQSNVAAFERKYPEADRRAISLQLLGDPMPISQGLKNPMALKTLHKLRGLLNYLLKEGKIDRDMRVVVEMARELNDANRRKALRLMNLRRQKENETFRKAIAACKGCEPEAVTDTEIRKYRLWEEQGRICLYTGQPIACTALFGPDPRFDFEHTLPASMSFDDELSNLTLADSHYNRNIKGNRLPAELPNYEHDAGGYSAIEPRLAFMKKHVADGQNKVKKWQHQSKMAATKEQKDDCIQQKHLALMELTYWRKKLQGFTTREFKAGWRNSQLKDTQVITKYALPYLKTVFHRTEVQKGTVTAVFRKIYRIKAAGEEKDRNWHWHHAEDAAVLTLIPTAAERERLMKAYFAAEENGTPYKHPQPVKWPAFRPAFVLNLKDDLLVNYVPEHRSLQETFKKVRKRGKIQYVQQTGPDGEKHFKRHADGSRVVKMAQGDTIRGSLHNDTFYGAIRVVEKDGKGQVGFRPNPKRDDDLFFVKKQDLNTFKTPDELEKIVDEALRTDLKNQLFEVTRNGDVSFEEAIRKDYWAFGKQTDRHGRPVQPIRHVRVFGKVHNLAAIRDYRAYVSVKPHKQRLYALNGEIPICALYEGDVAGKKVRLQRVYSLLEMARSRQVAEDGPLVEQNQAFVNKNKEYLIPLYAVLKVGQKVLFYDKNPEELKSLTDRELARRLYIAMNFEEGKIFFKHQLVAMNTERLKIELKNMGIVEKGSSVFRTDVVAPKLSLTQANWNFAVEGRHFTQHPDGSIHFL